MFPPSLSAALCATLLLTADVVSATPGGASSAANFDTAKRMAIPIHPPPTPRSTDEIRSWARRQAQHLRRKYRAVSYEDNTEKRASTGSVPLLDAGIDFLYFGTIHVGTPAQRFNVILDTGGSDLWLASSSCYMGCDGLIQPFNPSKSSTFQNTTRKIDIPYMFDLGDALGTIGNDTVAMSHFTVKNQAIGVMDIVDDGILQGNLSGLMGLAWTYLAKTGADPWWLTAIKTGLWTEPLFGFYLARWVDDPSATDLEAKGGSMDLGFANSDYYTGNINYVNLSAENFWLIPMGGITINGERLDPGGHAAIDTGAYLIGGPSAMMAKIYAQIPGAQAGTDDLYGYYVYPCTTNVTASLNFGGIDYSIESVDFSRSTDSTNTTCFGTFFAIDINSSVQWVVGTAFLKNVYTVFRAQPPSVGFATVKSTDNSGGGGGGNGTSTGSSTSSSPAGTNTKGGGFPTHSSGPAVKGVQVPILGRSGNGVLSGLVVMGLAVLFGGVLVL